MEEETSNASLHSNGEDRISRLPDHLIHHIMSCNDTKYAVQTSVLSKRWIDVWKALPFLKFYRDSFSKDKKLGFIMFVDMLFNRRCQDTDIQEFTVDWDDEDWDDSVSENTMIINVNRWSLFAVTRSVRQITIVINLSREWTYVIPDHLLNCESLRSFAMCIYNCIGRYVDVTLPRSINLPHLQELHLAGLSITDAESSKRLFSSCPVLELLEIFDCNMHTDSRRNLIVDSVSLKEFEYAYWNKHLLQQNGTMAKVIKLCAPNLKNFTCRSFLTQAFKLENCSPLSRVSFDMTLEENENAETYSELPPEKKKVYAKRAMQFLRAAQKVEHLTLSSGFLEVLSQAPDLCTISKKKYPRLCELQSLRLDMSCTRSCLRAIAYLLRISPNLKRIEIESKESNLADVGDDWKAGLSSPTMLSHLVYVKFEEVEGCDAELKLLRLLFKKAKVLEGVDIYFRGDFRLSERKRQVKRFRHKLRKISTSSSVKQLGFYIRSLSVQAVKSD